jgi:hypothetical protein
MRGDMDRLDEGPSGATESHLLRPDVLESPTKETTKSDRDR